MSPEEELQYLRSAFCECSGQLRLVSPHAFMCTRYVYLHSDASLSICGNLSTMGLQVFPYFYVRCGTCIPCDEACAQQFVDAFHAALDRHLEDRSSSASSFPLTNCLAHDDRTACHAPRASCQLPPACTGQHEAQRSVAQRYHAQYDETGHDAGTHTSGRPTPSPHVFSVAVVKASCFYGFNPTEEPFLRISMCASGCDLAMRKAPLPAPAHTASPPTRVTQTRRIAVATATTMPLGLLPPPNALEPGQSPPPCASDTHRLTTACAPSTSTPKLPLLSAVPKHTPPAPALHSPTAAPSHGCVQAAASRGVQGR